jgi:hypothetical protein
LSGLDYFKNDPAKLILLGIKLGRSLNIFGAEIVGFGAELVRFRKELNFFGKSFLKKFLYVKTIFIFNYLVSLLWS